LRVERTPLLICVVFRQDGWVRVKTALQRNSCTAIFCAEPLKSLNLAALSKNWSGKKIATAAT